MIRPHCPSLAAMMLGTALCAGDPAIDLPAGTTLKVAATAKDQNIQAPTSLAFDDEGRIIITETRRSGHAVETGSPPPGWYSEDLASHKSADCRALVEKWRDKIPAGCLLEKSAAVVRRLADADGDGVYEDSKVMASGFKDAFDGCASGVLAYQGTVFAGCAPLLWMLNDTAGSGAADERKPLLEGFGVHLSATGRDLRGFTVGPDGRLYGTIGDSGLNVTSKEAKTFAYPDRGCAFRFEADGSGFEVFHTGLHDPMGVAFDALGNAYTVDDSTGQGDAARLILLVDGGDSGWQLHYQALHDHFQQLGLTHRPPISWSEEHLWESKHEHRAAYALPPIAHLTGHPTALASQPGTGFLESEAGRMLVCQQGADVAHSGVWSVAITPDGAGMQATDLRPLIQGVTVSDAGFAWDGRLFLTDVGGPPRILAIDAGRNAWRATAAVEVAKLVREDFSQLEAADLGQLLKHPDFRIRLRAQLALTRMPDAIAQFSTAIASADRHERLHGIWGLGILARRGSGAPVPNNDGFSDIPDQKTQLNASQKLVGLLKHADAETRAQAVRAIGEAHNQFIDPQYGKVPPVNPLAPPPTVVADALPLAAMLLDESPRVRYQTAIAIGKLKAVGCFGYICDFIKANDNRDPYLRHAGAYALQRIAGNSQMIAAINRYPSAAVRLATTIAARYKQDPAVAAFINDPDPAIADEAIRAVTDLSLESVRISLTWLLDEPAARPWQPFMLRRLIHNAFRMGKAENASRLVKLVGNPAIPAAIQQESLRLLELWPEPPPFDQLTGQWRPLAKRSTTEVVPVLTAEMPRLLALDDPVRAAALELAKHYQIKSAQK